MNPTRRRRPLPLRIADGLLSRSAAAVRWLAFWTAVALPFAYLPIIGYFGGDRLAVVLPTTVAVHAVALVVGHGHNQPQDDDAEELRARTVVGAADGTGRSGRRRVRGTDDGTDRRSSRAGGGTDEDTGRSSRRPVQGTEEGPGRGRRGGVAGPVGGD